MYKYVLQSFIYFIIHNISTERLRLQSYYNLKKIFTKRLFKKQNVIICNIELI